MHKYILGNVISLIICLVEVIIKRPLKSELTLTSASETLKATAQHDGNIVDWVVKLPHPPSYYIITLKYSLLAYDQNDTDCKRVFITMTASECSDEPAQIAWASAQSHQSLRCSHTQYMKLEEDAGKEPHLWSFSFVVHPRLQDLKKLFSSQSRRGLVSASHASGHRIGPHLGPHLSHFFFFFLFFFNLVAAVFFFFFFS